MCAGVTEPRAIRMDGIWEKVLESQAGKGGDRAGGFRLFFQIINL